MEILLSILSTTDGGVREVQRAIGEGLIIGRGAEEGILLEGGDLSREHLVLTHDDAAIYVTDISANGTWLNRKQLKKSVRTRVRPEDSIAVPGYILTFRLVEQAPTADPTPIQSSEPSSGIPQTPSDPESTAPEKQTPNTALEPVFKFLSSFTAIERFMFVVAACGLLLLYAYAAS